MPSSIRPLVYLTGVFCWLLTTQTLAQTDSLAAGKKPKSKKIAVVKPLFASDEVLSLTLTARMQPILRDRVPPKEDEKGAQFPALLTVNTGSGADSGTVASAPESVPVKLQVRGHFRRDAANCTFPPLYLTVPKKLAKTNPFTKQSSLKLVTHCKDEAYVVHEYLAYRIYNLLTDLSFRARLVQVTYADSARKQSAAFSRWGILLEDDSDMAKRNRARLYKNKYRAEHCDTLTTATMALFEYMIGNTDWSVVYRHNVRLVSDSTHARPMPVPYDFDHSGLVSAPYAQPAEQLNIASVRERLYRGPIYPQSVLNKVIARFVAAKPQIYALYQNEKHADRGYIKQTLSYLDGFYGVLSDPQKVRLVFQDPNGRGVQIKGLGN